MSHAVLPFKISVLVFVRDRRGRHLLLQRAKAPNLGSWSPIGGKLEMATGESPCECAIREAREEIALEIGEKDLHLFGMISERAYEGTGHWLMFLYDCHKPVVDLPPEIDEGVFAFFTRTEIDRIDVPETDREALWPLYDRFRQGFVALRAECTPGKPLDVVIEETWDEPVPAGASGFRMERPVPPRRAKED